MTKTHKRKKNKGHGSNPPRTQKCCSADIPTTEEDLPYEIKTSDILGRYMVASRNLKPGEQIIEEPPLAVGPTANSDPVCLGCYKPVQLDSTSFKCPGCLWPLCSASCIGINSKNGHTAYECKLLESKQSAAALTPTANAESIKTSYELILPLRILLMKEQQPDDYKIVRTMGSHITLRRQNQTLWNHYQEVIVDKICNQWGLVEFSEDEVHEICGIIDVNCFEIGQNFSKARAIYPRAFLLAHDCVPNTSHTDRPQTFSIMLRTSRKIMKGEAITLSYAYTLQGTLNRREFMYAGKLFWCKCKRCADPTELNTDCSALKCPKCPNGFVRSSDPLNQDSEWKCAECPYNISAGMITELLDKLNRELESIDAHNAVGLENFIRKYDKLIGSQHYLIFSAKYLLCQIYGRTEDYLIHEMSEEDIQRKEKYCREFLGLVDILEPGLTRLRGLIMYELHAAIMVLSRRRLQNKLISRGEFNRNIREVKKLLIQSRDILKMEPEGSNEYAMGQAAEDALARMG